MELYFVLKYILFCLPPGEWVPLGHMMKGSPKNSTYSPAYDGL